MNAKRLRIAGHVQGVGYRDWMVRKANQLGVAGWVRNRRDGTVEAFVQGETAIVEELLRACRLGPPGASVSLIHEDLTEPTEDAGFRRLPTGP